MANLKQLGLLHVKYFFLFFYFWWHGAEYRHSMGARTSLFTWQNPPFIYLFIYIYNYYEFYKLYPVILHKIQFSPTIFTFI